MGTDIHIVVQVLLKKKWITLSVNPLESGRCYDTFKVLANVKNISRECICLPKGLPVELEHDSFYVIPSNGDDQLWLGDSCHSFFTLLDLLETNVSFVDTYLYNWITQLVYLKKRHKVHLSHIRVIFGFDS